MLSPLWVWRFFEACGIHKGGFDRCAIRPAGLCGKIGKRGQTLAANLARVLGSQPTQVVRRFRHFLTIYSRNKPPAPLGAGGVFLIRSVWNLDQ